MENISQSILPENTQEGYVPEASPQQAGLQSHQNQYAPQPQAVTPAQNMQQANQQAKETGVYPEFSMKPVQNNFKSKEAGRPIYDDVEWIKIMVAGDRNNIVERKVTDEDRHRFASYYAAFKAGEKQAMHGTPLEQWPMISRSQAAELKHFNIFTVEGLADLSDQGITTMGMGTRELVKQAQAYLAQAKDSAVPQALAAENERMRTEMDDLKRQIMDLGSTMDDYQEIITANKDLQIQVTNLENEVATLQTENAALQSQATAKPSSKKKASAKKKASPKPKAAPKTE